MAKNLVIDEELCEGCETCVSLCPDVFEMTSDAKAKVKNAAACDTCNCQEAIDSCPVAAIKWGD